MYNSKLNLVISYIIWSVYFMQHLLSQRVILTKGSIQQSCSVYK
jgi:hypothetical protein